MKNLFKNYFILSFFAILFMVVACKKDEVLTPAKSSDKSMSSFAFSSLTPAVSATITGTTVAAMVPFNVDITSLAPTISVAAKATVSPASGSTQNFTNAVTYTVTAEDGTTAAYSVTVTKGKNSAKDILTFAFNGLTPAVPAIIDATAKTIKATLPVGTDATKLVPTITLSDKATVSPATGGATDFSKDVTYSVTAEDGTKQDYKVTITVEKLVDGGTIYAGNYDGEFFALDALSGVKKWQIQLPKGTSATPTIANGIVYISCWDKKLYALDAATGAKKWEFLHGKSNDFAAPMVVNGIIYIAGDTKLYALDATTGVKKWEYQADDVWTLAASPTVVNGIVYFSNRGSIGPGYGFHAVDANTGARKWGPVSIIITSSSPCVANNIMYAGSEQNGLLALDASTGKQLWSFISKPNSGYLIYHSAPTVSNGIVYVGGSSSDPKLFAVDAATGVKKWEFLTGGPIDSSPIVANGIVYFGSGDYKLYALDAATGVKKWEVLPVNFNDIESSPLVANGLVYVTAGSFVFAYDAATGAKKWEFKSNRSFGSSSPCLIDKDGKIFYSGISGNMQ